MAQSEKIIWDILSLMDGHSIVMAQTMLGKETSHPIDNAYAVGELKGDLVLRHRPQDIEDTIYFMKNRNYIENHGFGMMAPEMAYSLTDKALEVSRTKQLPENEEQAFKEEVWDLGTPKYFGMGINLKEILRRIKKKWNI